MKETNYIRRLTRSLTGELTGNKAQSLLFLQHHGYRIPDTRILVSTAFDDYLTKGSSVLDKLKSEISLLPDHNFAIRSSTITEDSVSQSWAGQFLTLTNIEGKDRILGAIEEVWKSACLKNDYLSRSEITETYHQPKCAVIIQEMINPLLSGVSFSRNPVTGLNEVIVEAVEGLGEDLVQKGFTPHRWRIMGKTILEGAPNYKMFPVINSVMKATQRLKKSYGDHVDIEWAYDGNCIYYLQIRSITSRDNISVYSSRIAKEVLPGQIKPLVWSVNIPLVNGTWIQLLSEITGKLNVRPEDLAKSFYYRTYFNMAALGEIFSEFGLPVESLEFMLIGDQKMPKMMPGLKSLKHTFRIIRFVYAKLHFEPTFLHEYDHLLKNYQLLQVKIKNFFSVESYPEFYNLLFSSGRKLAYLNIVVPLLMQYYNKKLKKRLKKLRIDYDNLNFLTDFPELKEFSPENMMGEIKRKIDNLLTINMQSINKLEDLSALPQSDIILNDFRYFISKFGHLSESGNDFSVQKWEENPELVFQMILNSSSSLHRRELISFSDLSIPLLKKPALKKLFLKAGKFRVYREKISSLYIFGYGLFRQLFMQLGNEFAISGIIEDKDDIFYLTKQEIDSVIFQIEGNQTRDFKLEIKKRKCEMDEMKDLLLPTVIFGDEAPLLEKGKMKNFSGVGTSSGTYRGRTKIIKAMGDFKLVNRGDVLIIPFSDVSWTPILVKAGAIVSESGGMLSHCSIIARELGIPALVSVENACSLSNDLWVTVDGSNGILTIHDYE